MCLLSRFVYGLSSAYLLTGRERYRLAARACVEYQRERFRSLSHDGRHCFWNFGKRGKKLIVPSENPDDLNTIPLYEQIYALAGLAQYYRITQDWAVLQDIFRSLEVFDHFYRDRSPRGGFFSHIDYATMSYEVVVNSVRRAEQAETFSSRHRRCA